MELLLPSIEFKIELGKFSTLPAFYIFHARFTLIPQTSFSKSCHCSNLETSTPIGKWKYTNRRTENWSKFLSWRLFFSTRFESLWKTIYELFSRHLPHKLPPSFRYTSVYSLSSTHSREIAVKRIEETILSTGNDTRGEFPTGTRSTRL